MNVRWVHKAHQHERLPARHHTDYARAIIPTEDECKRMLELARECRAMGGTEGDIAILDEIEALLREVAGDE